MANWEKTPGHISSGLGMPQDTPRGAWEYPGEVEKDGWMDGWKLEQLPILYFEFSCCVIFNISADNKKVYQLSPSKWN